MELLFANRMVHSQDYKNNPMILLMQSRPNYENEINFLLNIIWLFIKTWKIRLVLFSVPWWADATTRLSKIIILLTDGNETCGGDVAEAINSLVSQGFNVRLDVVGVGIDEASLRNEFEGWAEAGGGVYYDAANSGDIAEAMADIFSRGLLVPYEVLDNAGNVVRTETVGGDPILLPAGDYTVQVMTNPAETYEISIADGVETAITIEQ